MMQISEYRSAQLLCHRGRAADGRNFMLTKVLAVVGDDTACADPVQVVTP